jgi:DNA polymerase elongation subunit (family B)
VAAYCAKDCDLPLDLLERLHVMSTLIQMSRVACTDLPDLVTRGQQIKVFQLIATFAHADYVINDQDLAEFHHLDMAAVRPAVAALPSKVGEPVLELLQKLDDCGEGDHRDAFETAVLGLSPTVPGVVNLKELIRGYEGAVVLEPTVGYHEHPVATLDFASLYPSIMQARNVCYSTLLLPSRQARVWPRLSPALQEQSEMHTIRGKTYTLMTDQPGVLPRILGQLLAARRAVKKAMKSATGFEHALLNGKQLALKVSCNSVYGFMGVNAGYLPCKPLAAIVTAAGRQMIEATRDAIYARYPGSAVIYGDTDSVMVIFAGATADAAGVRRTFALGDEAAAWITAHTFPSSFIELEMEKVYWPYILYKKKRYAGLMFMHSEDTGTVDTKGLENVRRDNCALLRSTLETVQDHILHHRVPAALAVLGEVLDELGAQKTPIAQLQISKTLRTGYASTNLPHVQVVERMKRRADPDVDIPRSGDRVQYVVMQSHNKNAKVYERTEDPDYVRQQKLPLDWLYYLENQLLPPLERLLAPFPAEVRQQLAAMGERTKHALICKRDGQDLRMLFTAVPRAARTAPVATPPPPKRCKQQGLAACWGH